MAATYLIIEHFRDGNAIPVYRRFRERGRMAPDGLNYIASWVSEDLTKCYQIMETPHRALLDQWMKSWIDLIEFEIHPVLSSAAASERIGQKL
jgi:hypothetical protein